MAQFCKQCADEMGFNPPNDIAYDYENLQTEEDDKAGYGSDALMKVVDLP